MKEKLLSDVIRERRATPNFDGSVLPNDILSAIIKAGIDAPSGYNIQPWRFVIVREEAQKKRLQQAAMNQPKVEEASVIIVCCGDLDAVKENDLNKVLADSLDHGFSEEQNEKVKQIINKIFSGKPGNAMGISPDYGVWLNRHVMIAFTTMMWMAEALGYDTAPMEGFYEDQVKSVLQIPDHVRVVALLGIGKLKGKDKPFAGRRQKEDICFSENWGNKIKF